MRNRPEDGKLPAVSGQLSAGKKAALSRKRRAAARKAVETRTRTKRFVKARAAEAASKEALRGWCEEHGWSADVNYLRCCG